MTLLSPLTSALDTKHWPALLALQTLLFPRNRMWLLPTPERLCCTPASLFPELLAKTGAGASDWPIQLTCLYAAAREAGKTSILPFSLPPHPRAR